MTQQMPFCIGDYNASLDNISKQIGAETRSLLKKNNTNIILQITCKGEVIVSSTNSELNQFYKILETELNKLTWIPGSHRGINQNVQLTVPVRIVNVNNELIIPLNYKSMKGGLVKCKIMDENYGIPISNVRLITKYNNCSYFSNQNGEVEFYCDAKDKIEISHINYQSFSFNAPENASSFQIKLTNLSYELKTVDLTKYSPEKLPHKNSSCNFEDWQENILSQIEILGLGDFYAPETAVFNGGFECFYNYIAQKFVLPESAFQNEYIDTVNISFTVAEDGTLKKLDFSKQLNYGIDTTLKNLFYEMPKWKPASQARQKTEQSFAFKLIVGINKYWEKNYR